MLVLFTFTMKGVLSHTSFLVLLMLLMSSLLRSLSFTEARISTTMKNSNMKLHVVHPNANGYEDSIGQEKVTGSKLVHPKEEASSVSDREEEEISVEIYVGKRKKMMVLYPADHSPGIGHGDPPH